MKIAVVGAGAGGLAAAYDLVRAGCAVTVFESEAQVGGLASGFKDARWPWWLERFYHHWFAGDSDVLRLIEELGWSHRLRFHWPVSATFHAGRFHALDAPPSLRFARAPWVDRAPGVPALSRVFNLLRFPGLTRQEALRAGLAALYLVCARDWRRLEQVTAHEWLTRRMGRRCYQTLWEPLLAGKFGAYARQVNMAWFWARIRDRTPRLGTFEGGVQVFWDDLAAWIGRRGGVLRLNTPVERIDAEPPGRVSVSYGGGRETFDHVLFTSSPERMALRTPGLPPEYAARLRGLVSMGAVVLVLALRRRLSEQRCYWHSLSKPAGFPFLVLVEHTNLVSPECFGGDHIVYCGDYLDVSQELFRSPKEEVLRRFLPALARLNPAFAPEWVRASWLFRTPYAQPVPFVNHSRSIPDLKAPVPGLWLASMDQVYPFDRTTNFAVRLGRRAAGRILDAPGAEGARARDPDPPPAG